MTSWSDVEREAPTLAAAVRARFDAYRHKTLATIRRDGSPRISGTEATFLDGELWLGMMPGSMKARDLLRDPRLAIHCATIDASMVEGDAKIAGLAILVRDPALLRRLMHTAPDAEVSEEQLEEAATASHLFRVQVSEVVLTRLGQPADHLVIEQWHPGRGVQRTERR